jgi:hypothetical protein
MATPLFRYLVEVTCPEEKRVFVVELGAQYSGLKEPDRMGKALEYVDKHKAELTFGRGMFVGNPFALPTNQTTSGEPLVQEQGTKIWLVPPS